MRDESSDNWLADSGLGRNAESSSFLQNLKPGKLLFIKSPDFMLNKIGRLLKCMNMKLVMV